MLVCFLLNLGTWLLSEDQCPFEIIENYWKRGLLLMFDVLSDTLPQNEPSQRTVQCHRRQQAFLFSCFVLVIQLRAWTCLVHALPLSYTPLSRAFLIFVWKYCYRHSCVKTEHGANVENLSIWRSSITQPCLLHSPLNLEGETGSKNGMNIFLPNQPTCISNYSLVRPPFWTLMLRFSKVNAVFVQNPKLWPHHVLSTPGISFPHPF